MKSINCNINDIRLNHNNIIVLDYTVDYETIELNMQQLLSQIGLSVYGYNTYNNIYWGKLFEKNKCVCSLYLHLNSINPLTTRITIENKIINNNITQKIIQKLNKHIDELVL